VVDPLESSQWPGFRRIRSSASSVRRRSAGTLRTRSALLTWIPCQREDPYDSSVGQRAQVGPHRLRRHARVPRPVPRDAGGALSRLLVMHRYPRARVPGLPFEAVVYDVRSVRRSPSAGLGDAEPDRPGSAMSRSQGASDCEVGRRVGNALWFRGHGLHDARRVRRARSFRGGSRRARRSPNGRERLGHRRDARRLRRRFRPRRRGRQGSCGSGADPSLDGSAYGPGMRIGRARSARISSRQIGPGRNSSVCERNEFIPFPSRTLFQTDDRAADQPTATGVAV
jgi:hypothetical protein